MEFLRHQRRLEEDGPWRYRGRAAVAREWMYVYMQRVEATQDVNTTSIQAADAEWKLIAERDVRKRNEVIAKLWSR